MPRVATKTLR